MRYPSQAIREMAMNVQKLFLLLVWLAIAVVGIVFPTIAGHTSGRNAGIRRPAGNTYTVCDDGTCDYDSISTAIAAASDGDTLQLTNGRDPQGYPIPYEEVLTIPKDLYIVGVNPDDTIIQANDNPITNTGRVITITQSATVVLDNVTIRNGSTYSGTSSTAGYGGGILVQGVLTLTNSVVDNNDAEFGGGIHVEAGINDSARLIVIDSTVKGNRTDSSGGGISVGGDGNVQVSILNSTISGNDGEVSGGGIYISNANSTVQIIQSTFNGNSSAIGKSVHLVNGNLTLTQSILANGYGGNVCRNDSGTVTDGGFSLVDDGSCGFPVGGDPLLDNLGNNGGSTPTHALRDGSPALDAVPSQHCAGNTDQRGETRPFGAGCDIGAFERNDVSLSFIQVIDPDETWVAPEQYITTTLYVVPSGAGLTNGVITATIPAGLSLQGSPQLDPPDAGQLGTLPILVHSIVITANHRMTVTMYAQVDWGLPFDTDVSQAFSFTSTEIVTPVLTTRTLMVRNVPPVARDDSGSGYATDANKILITSNVLANDDDANGDAIECIGFNTDNTRGKVTYNGDGTFTYDPRGRFEDEPLNVPVPDTFLYTIDDGRGGQDTATVTIMVTRAEILVYLPLIIR